MIIDLVSRRLTTARSAMLRAEADLVLAISDVPAAPRHAKVAIPEALAMAMAKVCSTRLALRALEGTARPRVSGLPGQFSLPCITSANDRTSVTEGA